MPSLAIVIPTLNAHDGLSRTFASLDGSGRLDLEVVVADGGSTDGTAGAARDRGVRVVDAPKGRGNQLAAGAAATKAPWLLFLHADTTLAEGWQDAATAFMADPDNRSRAAAFRLRFDDPSSAARRVEWIAARRSRWLGLPYGDQGLLIARDFYDALGGFKPIPIMEDVDLVRRVGRRRLVTLPCDAVTSAARYRRMGYVPRMARNLMCLTSYLLGMPPRWLVRLYG